VADAAEHEAAVSPACFHLRERREALMQSFPLRGLLQKEPFWCCFPSPGVQPAGVEGSVSGEAGAETQMLCGGWSVLWALGCSHSSAASVAGTSAWQEQPMRCCVLCHARSAKARAAQRGSEVVLRHRWVCDRERALSWPALMEDMLCRAVVAPSAGQASLIPAE